MKKTSRILFFIALLFVSQLAIGQKNDSVDVKVVFPFSPTNVVLYCWYPTQYNNMIYTGQNEFSTTINSSDKSTIIFNIRYALPQYNINELWVAAGNLYTGDSIPNRLDAHGLKYGQIYINNQLINNLYTISNWDNNGLDISVKINSDNSIVPNFDPNHVHLSTNDRIPQEAHHHKTYRNRNVPYPEDINVVGWVVALTDNNILDTCTIDVDYIKVFGRVGNNLTPLCSNDYTTYNPDDDGGLYLRYPFFPEGFDEHDPMPGTLSQGILTIYPSQNNKKAWHWWSDRFTSSGGFNYDSYRVECRLRITGHAVVQAGIDFRNASETVHELGVSDWYFENNGTWQDVVFDSKDITTSIISASKLEGNVQLFYNKNENNIHIKYTNVLPDTYELRLYNIKGQNLASITIILNDPNGDFVVSVSELPVSVNVFSLSNENRTFNGKIATQ